MWLLKIVRNPFALIGEGFVLGGLLFLAVQDAPPAHAAQPQSAEASR